jgi:2-polyprenyl-6-methoxyphenol hydroxylase-like FAD-dependent oxidoreductase
VIGHERSDRYDVVVVGARVAGAATALLLARAGLRVLVVDRGRPGADTLSTHALTRGGVIQLHRWGVLDAVIGSGTPPVTRTTFHYGAESVAIDLEPRDGIDALYAPRRTVLDPILVEAALDAGADIHHGCKVVSLLRDESGGVNGVDYVDLESDSAHRTQAAMTVGADGVRSIVARECSSTTTWSGPEAGAMLYGYFPDPGIDGYHWCYRPRATAGVIPTNDQQVCMWVGTSSERFNNELRGDPAAAFALLSSEAAPEFSEAINPQTVDGRLFGYAGQPSYLRQPWGRGWALVGDSGYFKDPLTAHGITDALRDAELLAVAIIEHLTSDETNPLAAYQARRDQLSADFADVTNRIASYAWDIDEIKALVREEGHLLAEEARLLSATASRHPNTP